MMPLFVCMPLYSFPHLLPGGAPYSHGFLNKYTPTQEPHFLSHLLSVVLFFSSERSQIFGPSSGHFPRSKISTVRLFFIFLSHFLWLLSIFLSVGFLLAICLLCFFPFHHNTKSLKAGKKRPNIDYFPFITQLVTALLYQAFEDKCVYMFKLALAEEFGEKKKLQHSKKVSFLKLLLLCTYVSGWNAAANSCIITKSYISGVLESLTAHLLVCVCIDGLYMQLK